MTGPAFEEHLDRLEQISAALDRADTPLDDALKLFEEGIARLRAASETLESAEGRLKELVERAGGSLEPSDGVPLESDDSD